MHFIMPISIVMDDNASDLIQKYGMQPTIVTKPATLKVKLKEDAKKFLVKYSLELVCLSIFISDCFV